MLFDTHCNIITIIIIISIIENFYDPDFGNCFTIPAKNADGLPLEAREGDFWQESNRE